ncbi:hypothetical protein BGZ82_010063 [Podila clonocystis]|nr:hypothetical protein BGZ82_010063 [Podila clonocystis]
MSHLNVNLSSNYYAQHDPTSQTLDHPEQVFGDHVHVSHDGSPNYTDAMLRHLNPQEQSTHVHHLREYYNQSFSSSSTASGPHLGQAGVAAVEHGYMGRGHESPCVSCDPQNFSSPPMSVAMPFSAFRREHSAGNLSTAAASLDDLSFHGAHDMSVTFSSLPNSPHVNSLLPQSYEPQTGWHHYQHGACQGTEN